MDQKPETVEELAELEKAADLRYSARRQTHLADAELLAKTMPKLFFDFAKDVRVTVKRWNDAAEPPRRMSWNETPAIAAADAQLGSDFRFAFGRRDGEITVGLHPLSPSDGPPAFIMQAIGKLRSADMRLRGEGFVKDGEPQWRIFINGQRIKWPFSELAERLVRAVIHANLRELERPEIGPVEELQRQGY